MYRVPVRDDESWLLARLRRHISELLRLAGPVVVARAGLLVMAIVDTIFVGRYGTTDLDHLVLANAPVGTIIGNGIGLLIGVLVMTSTATGSGAQSAPGSVWRRGAVY